MRSRNIRHEPLRGGPPRGGHARRLKALIVKEFRQVVRDPSSILIAFILPLLLLFLFGYGVSLDATNVSVAVVVEDSGPEAVDLAATFQGTRFFDTYIASDLETAKSNLVAGRVRGIVVIPQDFCQSLRRPGVNTRLQLITDVIELH